MPVYEYGCPACGNVTDLLQRRYDPPTSTPCIHCGHASTQRLISQVAFKVAYQAKYSGDFTEKAMPTLKKKFPNEFQGGNKQSDEATAHRLNEKIGASIDRSISTHLKNSQAPT